MPFETQVASAEMPAPTWTTKIQKIVVDYSSILRPAALLVLFLLAYLFILRPVQKHVMSMPPQLPARTESAPQMAQMEAPSAHTPELTGGGRARAALLKEQTAEMIRQKPVNTARAVQAWLHEEPS
jgi:flagellar M-ring protein FliF